MNDIQLGIAGFQFSHLYDTGRLKDLHSTFWQGVKTADPDLCDRFSKLGEHPYSPPEESKVLIETAVHLGGFLARLFKIETSAQELEEETRKLAPIFRLKKDFLNIRVFKRFTEAPVPDAEYALLDTAVKNFMALPIAASPDPELSFASIVLLLLDSERALKADPKADVHGKLKPLGVSPDLAGVATALKLFEDWSVQTWVDPKRRRRVAGWLSYVRAHKLDFDNLVPVLRPDASVPEKTLSPHLRYRDGFKLTDPRMTNKEYLREVDYCIYCHERQKDSCSKGFPEKEGGFKKNPLGIELKGCPLDERISEAHYLKKEGHTIAALAMIMLDNPMCPGTGHRICNDCMKGCIFQKQDPVNIPQIETGILTDVLNLPYGFEIYSLLTRFNPLNRQRPYALPYNGNDVLVVGLGPAGYTLTHYLANEGFGVVGIDGLKLEPVDDELTGRGKAFPKPIEDFSELKNALDERILMGFGGVSEYGITVRWDKNFLLLIYLTLLRRKNLRFYGGVRFGGTLNLEDAWELGFKHVALATGAGRPSIIRMKNNLIRGIRKASDFLMALQLTGAFKRASMANLQVQLPAVVIGGGLTAIDTATELLAYYPIQVEKVLERYEELSKKPGSAAFMEGRSEEDRAILATFLEHGKAIRAEREKAKAEKREPDFISLCRQWGGVSIAYRKRMQDSPAYRLNHEEVIKALEEGIAFVENMTPVEAIADKFGAVEALDFSRPDGTTVRLPAKSVCVAAGTSPNIVYEKEYPGSFELDADKYFFKKFSTISVNGKWELKPAEPDSKDGFFLSAQKDGCFVTFYGDNHPDYAGNVVKAMASAKHGAPHIAKLFAEDIARAEKSAADRKAFDALIQKLDVDLVPRVVRVDRLTPTIVEVIVKGKYVSNKFLPGQFYRLQNYETLSKQVGQSRLTMEGLALTGAWVEKEKDLLSLIVLEMGGSSRLCSALKPGEPVVVMGPTGAPSEIPHGQTMCLVGGGLGNAVLLSIAKACREAGTKVIYFAGYRRKIDLFKQTEIEQVTDQVIWAVDAEDPIPARRKSDLSFVGNIVQAMEAYASGKLHPQPMFDFKKIDHMIAIGSDRMMAAVQAARHGVLKPYLKPDHVAIASINSSMQCMMKEVCAQCLQKHIDPKTGKETKVVFSCFNQDQEMDCVDFKNLNDRLRMNSLQEYLSNRYLDTLFEKADSLPRV